jgi:hypothetical protein
VTLVSARRFYEDLRGARWWHRDKIVSQTEVFQLLAPIFEVVGESTRSVLFAHRPLSEMSKQDRVRA